MPSERMEGLLLVLKSILVLVGVIVIAAAAVELVVGGWSLFALAYLAAGLLLAGAPLASAFRDALRSGKGPA